MNDFFETSASAHNLKVVGSNPTPATKKLPDIKCLDADRNSQASQSPLYINATSTFAKAGGAQPVAGQVRRYERESARRVSWPSTSGEKVLQASYAGIIGKT